MTRFDNKVVIVTGGSLGIGEACSRAFAERGAIVVVASRDVGRGEALSASLETAGGTALHVATDVSREADVVALVERTLERFGRIDVLVNNAGVYAQGDVFSTTRHVWERIMAVNLTGAFLCTKHAAEALVKNQGTVINVSSEAGLVGIANQVAYNVSKAALIALTKSCAVDLADRGVRVNCICPGTTATPLVETAIGRAEDPAAARHRLETCRPMNRLGTPEEIASAVIYFASDGAGYATGAVLSLDGGYTAQ